MGDGFQYIDIIFLAMIAAFIALRLRSVLGRRTGHERRIDPDRYTASDRVGDNMSAEEKQQDEFDSGAERSEIDLDPNSPVYFALRKIHQRDRSFDVEIFVTGAKAAYEMILDSFWKGNADELRPLVGDEVLDSFNEAIRLRQESGLKVDNKLVSINKVDIVDADISGSEAHVTVKFTSDIVLITRDSENRVVEGDLSDASVVTDIWTFARKLDSRDPNWILISTRSGE